MLRLSLLVAGLWSLAGTARADEHAHAHHHAHDAHADHTGHALLGGMHDHTPGYAVSVGVLAASYTSPIYEGDYQGAQVGARATWGRVGVGASLAAYRITKNGKTVDGIGDVTLHAHAVAVTRGAVMAGVMVMATLPTADDTAGLGMGHVMLMPEAWIMWTPGRLALSAAAGYARMFGGHAAHAEHGVALWPLVDPMNAVELPFEGTAMVALAPQLGIGAKLVGGVPLGDGDTRLAAGGRLAWIAGSVTTSAELLGGVAGDPFGLRGVIETSLRF